MSAVEDRSVGTLLGVACGDVLGAPLKGNEAQVIAATHGRVGDFLDVEGKYTDDTQLTIALGDSLVEHGFVSIDNVPTKYCDYYNPLRGYAESSSSALDSIAKGLDTKVTGRVAFREGSYGSGASTRISPVGIAYRNASDDVLHKAVVDAVLCTHTHAQAVDAAFIQAKSVATLVKADPASFDSGKFLESLRGAARNEVIRNTIQKALNQINRYASSQGDTTLAATTGDDVIGNGVSAADALGSALLIFGRFWKTPEDALINAVALGGDTDTIAAHTGALLGALHGTSWIPRRWHDKIENGKHGRDFITALAKKLATLDVTACEGRGESILKQQEESVAKGEEFPFEEERKQEVQSILDKIDVKLQRIKSK